MGDGVLNRVRRRGHWSQTSTWLGIVKGIVAVGAGTGYVPMEAVAAIIGAIGAYDFARKEHLPADG